MQTRPPAAPVTRFNLLRNAATRAVVTHRGFLIFMLGMLFFRSAMADWYAVPSGSMYPTVLVGDRIISNRLAYDVRLPFTDLVLQHIADPQRGDIVTFTSPADGTRLVKRLVGLPGDTIALRDEVLYINGVAATYTDGAGSAASSLVPDYSGAQVVQIETTHDSHRTILLMPQRDGVLRSFGPLQVPPGEYLMLGDNRDDSMDSRYIGCVPRAAITGRVSRVAFSLDSQRFLLPRFERFGVALGG